MWIKTWAHSRLFWTIFTTRHHIKTFDVPLDPVLFAEETSKYFRSCWFVHIQMRPGSGSVVGLWLFFSSVKTSFLKPVCGSYWNPHIKDKYLMPSYVRTVRWQSWPSSYVVNACGAGDQVRRLRCIAPYWPTLDRQTPTVVSLWSLMSLFHAVFHKNTDGTCGSGENIQ